MLKNYLTIGWRNLVRSTGFSVINISGLAIGMTIAMLIGLWVHDELSYNRSFRNYDRIGWIYHHLSFNGEYITHSGVPYPMGEELRSSYPEFKQVMMELTQYDRVIGYGDNVLTKDATFVEPGFIDMFSVNIVQGSAKPFQGLHSVMVSQSLAKALVGGDAIGKVVRIDANKDLEITAVFEDFPVNSQFKNIEILMSMDYYASISRENRNSLESWNNMIFDAYVLLDENVGFVEAGDKIKNVISNASAFEVKSMSPEGFIFPMSDWNLRAEFKEGKQVGGKIEYVWMFGTVGAFILILACINFVNLSTARSERRSKEIGVRKVMGSKREQLITQFLSESQLITVIAFAISIVLVMVLLPWFNMLAEKNISIPFTNPWFIAFCLGFIVLTSFMAGSYPALYMSSFNPVWVLKGAMRAGRSNLTLRKGLVVFQFTVCMAVIGCTIVVFQQIQYSKNRPAGFDREGLFFLKIKTPALERVDYNLLRNDLLATGAIDNAAISDAPTTGNMRAEAGLTWQGKDPALLPLIALNSVSHDFPKTNGFMFVEGRDFSRDLSSDTLAILINEMCAELIAPGKSAIGTKITWGKHEREVVGVIKDQLRWGPYSKQSAHIYYIDYKTSPFITVKISQGASIPAALDQVKAVIRKYDPSAPFDYKFIDEDFNRQFKTEERIGSLATVFAILAIFISCIGILGLASFAASQRVKEIGIRKILGASIFSIWRMLSKDFIILVILAMVIAVPLSRYVAMQWLEQYDYRVDVSWWIFIATGIGAIAVTLATISYQSVKAATNNPVNSLRSE